LLVLSALGVLTADRIAPYAALMTCYILASSTFGMAFGFVIPRSEYYGLPVFRLVTLLSVCGAYLAADFDYSIGIKLFFSFLSPSVGMVLGVVMIESYFFRFGSPMNYSYISHTKSYPTLNNLNMVLLLSALMYFLIVLVFPLDGFYKWMGLSKVAKQLLEREAGEVDESAYPYDKEEEETNRSSDASLKRLLEVNSIYHVYPDGTKAVSNVSFTVKEGEVLSFLGANGAGKSTCMKMLCGTLDATRGDALVNGYSITTHRTLARRKLGIAMQQDIIWVRL